MSHAFDIFPFSVKDKLFKTDAGDVCLCLHEVWPSLLTDLSLLGPILLISRSEQIALVSIQSQLDFVPVPDSTEMLDLSSGLSLDTINLGAVMAGQEARTGSLSMHFFDLEGREIFKVLLAPGADVDEFIQIVSHYGKHPLRINSPSVAPHTSPCEGVVLADDLRRFQTAWTSFSPALGGDFLPGIHGVSWLDALRLGGHERALFLTKVGLLKAILAAYKDQIRLRMTCCQRGLHHEATFTPRRLERCGQCLHLFDVETEAHFFLEPDCEIWAGFHGKNRVPAIHIFSRQGYRRGIIQFAGERHQEEGWSQALYAAAGVRRSG